MKINDQYLPYLSGKVISASLPMKMADGPGGQSERVAFLEQAVTGKRVLHVGCLDHVDLIEPRILANTWLHKRLTDVAERCLGIDIDEEGAAEARRHGFDNVLISDLAANEPHSAILEERWDYIILGEVLEHIDNPVRFLEEIASKYASVIDRVLITVPNAFHLDNFRNVLRHTERINTDHRFWFTPYTLARVATAAGLVVEDYRLCLHKPNVPRWRLLYRAMLFLFPLLRGSLVMELSLPGGDDSP